MSTEEKENYREERPDEDLADPADFEDTANEPTEDESTPEEVEEPEPTSTDNPVTWTAEEYIHNDKNGLWYVLFVVVVLGFLALDIFVLKSYTFSALIVVMSVALFIYSRRPPRTIQYTLSGNQGLYVGERLYKFASFKAFGLIKDGEHHSIMLIPTKRFSPGVSVYFPEEFGEQIVDIFGARLPMQKLELDLIDVVVRQLRL